MTLLVLILLGLALGSFVNALVYRLHHQEEAEGGGFRAGVKKLFAKLSGDDDRYSILKGRSMCPHCKRTLRAKDLVPVVSWLMLRGRCRDCKKPISLQYPLVELALATAFVLSYLVWPLPLDTWYQWVNFGAWLASLVGLAALFVYDFRWSKLPYKIIYPLIALAVANAAVQFIAYQPQGNLLETVLFYVLGLLPVAGLYYIIYTFAKYFSKKEMVGDGDIMLGIFIGLALGWPGALLVLFLANLLGTLVVIPPMLMGKLTRQSRIPFGPFLIVAFVIAGLWGGDIIGWYLSSLGVIRA